MKQILTFLLLLCSLSVSAQDIIVKKNGQPIKCRIVEETADEIVYKKWEDINGSNYVMNRQDALSVTRDETLVRTAEPMPSSASDLFSSQYDDEHLKMLDAQRHPYFVEQSNPYAKKMKRLKWTAIGTAIATPIVAVGGIACVIPASISIGTGIRCARLKKKIKKSNYYTTSER